MTLDLLLEDRLKSGGDLFSEKILRANDPTKRGSTIIQPHGKATMMRGVSLTEGASDLIGSIISVQELFRSRAGLNLHRQPDLKVGR
jgi:hypothetical protein